MTKKSPRPLTGRHVLIILLSFFGVTVAVNGYFIYQANKTWPGLESDTAYEDGLAYNQTLETAEAQRNLELDADISLTQSLVSFTIKDRDGQPVAGLTPSARIGRTTTQNEDQTVILTDQGEGIYTSPITLNPGQWAMVLEAQLADGFPFRLERKFVLP